MNCPLARTVLTSFFFLVIVARANAQQSYSWATATNGSWATPGAWSPNGTPGSVDTATIGTTGSNYIVSVDAATSVRTVTLSSANATLGGAGVLTVGTGGFNWSAGTFSGHTVLNNGGSISTPTNVLTMTNGSSLSVANSQILGVSILGSGSFDVSGAINLGTSARLALASGRINLNDGATITGAGTVASSGTIFLNTATPFSIPFLTLANGTVTGLASASANVDGFLVAGSGGTVTGTVSGISVTANQLTLNGSLQIDDGTVTVSTNMAMLSSSGPIQAKGTSRLTIASTATWLISPIATGGVVVNAQLLTQNGGTLRVDQNGTTNLGTTSGTGTYRLIVGSGVTFNNAGTFNARGSALNVDAAATFDNSGTVNLLSGVVGYNNPASMTVAGTLANSGTIAATGTASLPSAVTVTGTWNNSGTFTADGHTSFTNSGTVASLAGSFNIPDAANLTNYSAGTLTGGTWRTANAGFDWGTRAIVTSNATVELNGAGAAFPALNAITQNGGTLRVLDGATLTPAAAGIVTTGSVEIGAGSTFAKGITTQSAGSIRGAGTVGGPVVVQSGGRITPGAGANTALTVNADSAIHGGSGTTWDVTVAGVAPNTAATASMQSGRIVLTDASKLNLIASSSNPIVLNVILESGTFTVGQPVHYVIANATDGTNFQTNGGTFAFDPTHFTLTTSGFSGVSAFELSVVGPDLVLGLTPVPEPATVLLFAASLVVLGGVRRKRLVQQ